MTLTHELEVLGEVALAMLLGGVLGLEREAAHKPAGLRTHMIVAGASALLVALTDAILRMFVFPYASGSLRADPVLVLQAVVTAVGFIGAGTIIRRPDAEVVEGLTTAASMLFTAAVGMAVARRQFRLAIGATILALIALRGVKWLENKALLRRGESGSKA